MRKLMALFMALIFALSLAACGDPAARDNTAGFTEATPTETADPDTAVKTQLLDRYGYSFKFYLAFGMELITFEFDDSSVLREHHDSMKDGVLTHNAAWDIIDGELVVTGEWNETFTLDLDAGTATSKTDGREYSIFKSE